MIQYYVLQSTQMVVINDKLLENIYELYQKKMSVNFTAIKGVAFSNDEMQILDFMADNNQSFRTFVRHQVAGFYIGSDFHLIIYIHNEFEETRFQQFTVPDYKNNKEALYRLIYALETEIQQMKYPVLYSMAKDKVVHVVHAMVKPIR